MDDELNQFLIQNDAEMTPFVRAQLADTLNHFILPFGLGMGFPVRLLFAILTPYAFSFCSEETAGGANAAATGSSAPSRGRKAASSAGGAAKPSTRAKKYTFFFVT